MNLYGLLLPQIPNIRSELLFLIIPENLLEIKMKSSSFKK